MVKAEQALEKVINSREVPEASRVEHMGATGFNSSAANAMHSSQAVDC